MLSLGRYEAKICECGFHESLASDPANYFTFKERICPVCKGAAQYLRQRQKRDDQERRGKGKGALDDPADGRYAYMRLMTPDEVEEVRHRRSSRVSPPRT